MSRLKLLIVEDDEQDLENCRDAVSIYEDEKQVKIELIESKDVEDAHSKLDNSFDGAIIDLKLGFDGDEGNQVIRKIEELQFRIPVFILTATPDAAEAKLPVIEIFKKGDINARYNNLLDIFWGIYNTGLTRIMGGRGLIEQALPRVFHQILSRQKDIWIEYGRDDSSRTEKALLRHTLNHLLQILDHIEDGVDEADYYPEEVYLMAPSSTPSTTDADTELIRTGSIVKEKDSNKWFVILTPACDLVVRESGSRNTDRFLMAEVDSEDSLFPWVQDEKLSNTNKNELKKAYQNNKSTYYHWLPAINSFEGGFINFRKLFTVEIEKFRKQFPTDPEIHISPPFVKDIVARFSSYYARQGQPGIDFEKFVSI